MGDVQSRALSRPGRACAANRGGAGATWRASRSRGGAIPVFATSLAHVRKPLPERRFALHVDQNTPSEWYSAERPHLPGADPSTGDVLRLRAGGPRVSLIHWQGGPEARVRIAIAAMPPPCCGARGGKSVPRDRVTGGSRGRGAQDWRSDRSQRAWRGRLPSSPSSLAFADITPQTDTSVIGAKADARGNAGYP